MITKIEIKMAAKIGIEILSTCNSVSSSRTVEGRTSVAVLYKEN